MEQSSLFLKLKPDLISIGLGFTADQTEKDLASQVPADPEETILRALGLFYEDRKAFRMLLSWMMEFSPFIHVERLLKLSQRAEFQNIPILGAVCQKMVNYGDRRFKLITSAVLKLMRENSGKSSIFSLPEGIADSYLIAKYGEDEEFKLFGINIARIDPEDSKKLLPMREILKGNPWLKFRILIGANFRADLAYLISAKRIKKPNQAAKILGCARETAYRLWREVSLYEGIEKLAS